MQSIDYCNTTSSFAPLFHFFSNAKVHILFQLAIEKGRKVCKVRKVRKVRKETTQRGLNGEIKAQNLISLYSPLFYVTLIGLERQETTMKLKFTNIREPFRGSSLQGVTDPVPVTQRNPLGCRTHRRSRDFPKRKISPEGAGFLAKQLDCTDNTDCYADACICFYHELYQSHEWSHC